MKHLFLTLVCLLVSTPVLSATDVSTPPAQTTNRQVSIEDIRKIIPAEALPLITDKTLEYMKFVAETWPILKGSEEETEFETTGGNIGHTKTVKTPLMPGIMQSSQSLSGIGGWQGLDQKQTIMSGLFNSITSMTYSDLSGSSNLKLSSIAIDNINAHEGHIFPLKVGNSEKISFLTKITTTSNHNKTLNHEDETTEIVATVMDQINGSPEDSNFPFPVNGKIWIIAFKRNSTKTVEYLYYSEELNSFISLNRPEDILTIENGKLQKTISFKLLN